MNPLDAGAEPTNPLGIEGLEFVEFATPQPQALGALLQMMGFAAIARHRSREVMLYRQGPMNIVVNADIQSLPASDGALGIVFESVPIGQIERFGPSEITFGFRPRGSA